MRDVSYKITEEYNDKYFNYTVRVFDEYTEKCIAIWGVNSLADAVMDIAQDVIVREYELAGVKFEDKNGNIFA